ncbi:lipid asymmetry maintenance ABC transporter permease subunit MlaE [Suttonella sp. R2A3]|uniref:lipid asymmetry maintenance ABC transporter permease subunit MlaE n=1 Tax=Suttonella sp. R2A3 TaxID=2908648 RepID=UPI001F260C82|nr:lipid asymmetry maintenance ABC transporter permease subunit MlaE [Suttonella sp. R2A3]UJF24554.1 lipid asymmetry maintenance ABC transporter permease subunit MlaE [Suttonella sp. R2A3]
MIKYLERIGSASLDALQGLGGYVLFALQLLRHTPVILRKPLLMVRATYFSGVLSLPIIIVAGFFVGMVLAFQGYSIFVRFGAEESLSLMVDYTLLRELGAVVSALLFAGRAGSAITAEIGLMKTTEQLAAMEMMSIEPLAQIGAPRFCGALLAMPLLALVFSAVAIFGAYVVGVVNLGVDAGIFWSQMQTTVDLQRDLVNGLVIKSVVFGFLIASIAVFQGFTCPPTAEGMANATTKTVVLASLAVLGFDFVLTALMYGG